MRKSKKHITSLLLMMIIGGLLSGCGTEKMPNHEESGNEKHVENSDLNVFDVQNGKLISYSGEETVVSLPESVLEITSDSFSSKKEDIKSLYIGENVMRIADDAFVGMINLASVKVADGNAYYSSTENFLVSNTGSTMFMFGNEKFDTSIFDYADTVGAQNFCEDGFKIVFGEAVLHFDGTTDKEPRTSICSLERIDVFGKSVDLNTNFEGNHAVTLQYADDCLLITDYTYGVGDTYIISEEGIWEQHNDEVLSAENCNDPIVTVSVDTDGSLIFLCKPRKYIFSGTIGDLLKYSCGKDELYSVEGALYFDGSYPQYSIEKNTTLSENYTDDQLKDEFDAINSSYEQFDSLIKYETIDELFVENKSKYGVFEWIK